MSPGAVVAAAVAAAAQAGAVPGLERIVRDAAARSTAVATVLEAPETYRAQLLLAVVDGHRLARSGFRADAEYFYPASTIKLVAAVGALQVLHELAAFARPAPDADTPMALRPLFAGDAPDEADGAVPVTVGRELQKLLVASDNTAFDRLYALVGQRGLNERAWRAGLSSVRVQHRLAAARTPDENRMTPAVELRTGPQPLLLPARTSDLLLATPEVPGLAVGRAFFDGRRDVPGPTDFSGRNRISLSDLQNLLVAIEQPSLVPGVNLELAAADLELLRGALSGRAADLGDPQYVTEEYSEERLRPALPGVARVVPREALEAAGKMGYAYGFLCDTAYFRRRSDGQAFFLAGVIHVNASGVLNNGAYEYDTLARPFFADVGEAVAREVFGH